MLDAGICRSEAVDRSHDKPRRPGRRLSATLGGGDGLHLDLGTQVLASVMASRHGRNSPMASTYSKAWSSAHPEWPLASPDATTTGGVVVQ